MWIVGGFGTRGLKGGLLCWRRASCPGKALAGAAEATAARVFPGLRRLPQQESCQGSPPRPLALSVSWSWCCFGCLVLWLPSSALLSVAMGAALTARAQVKGYKREPLFLYTDKVLSLRKIAENTNENLIAKQLHLEAMTDMLGQSHSLAQQLAQQFPRKANLS